MNFFRLAGSAIFTAAISLAASSAAWEMNSYQDFLRGKFTNISLSRDGRLMLGPRIETLLDTGEQAVWATAKASDGSTYVATGHRGKLFRINARGDKSLVWTSSQPEIFALTIDSKGVVYAGTSPDGKIYRLENGAATEYYTTKAKFVWSLLSINGTLFAGTDQGNVHKITGPNLGEVYYASGQGHVTVLTQDKEGRLLAGTEPNGILYRITAKDKAFVLMDANLPELRTVIPAEDGSIYVAALGGSLAGRGLQTGTPASVNPVTVPGISVTVTEQASHGTVPTVDLPKPDKDQKAQPQTTPQPAPVAATQEIAGVEKSAIYRIHPDNTVETLWSSKDENAYSLLRVGDYLVFGTDMQGRLYRLSADRKVTLLSETNESTITSLSAYGPDIVATSSDQGKVLKLGAGYNGTGTYESPVHDSSSVARWGRYDWRAELCDQCKVKMETRSGNSSRPDRT